jgi:DNA-directed RNA polymerase specialized sigma24 family protein
MHSSITFIKSLFKINVTEYKRKEKGFIKQLHYGELMAWEEFIDFWGPRLYNYVIYNTASEADAQKLVRMILSEVVQTIGSVRHITNLTTLIFAIAYQQVMHYHQHTTEFMFQRQWQLLLPSEGCDDQWRRFVRKFCRLSHEIQQIFLFRYLCGVSLREISQVVGQSEDLLAKVLYGAKFSLQ